MEGAIRRLVVLPFVNASGDENTDILCDGITEVLIRQLSRAKDLAVIGRGTAFQFKGTERDPRDIGKQLAVQGVLHGSVSERGGRVVVDVELIDARTGVRIWGDQLNRPASDVLAVQNEIAATIITDGLGRSLSKTTIGEQAGVMAADHEAYRLFLEAVHRFRGVTETDYLAARALLTQAVARDPTFALAHVTLASTYSVRQHLVVPRTASTSPRHRRTARRRAPLISLPLRHGESQPSDCMRQTHGRDGWSAEITRREADADGDALAIEVENP